MIGTRISHYEIVGELGCGGMGQVYVARDTRLDRDVALKVLPSDLAEDPDRLARFEREAKTLAALNHPNIVTIFSVEHADGVRFMTMELVRGTTLDGHVPEGGMAMRAFLELAEPLADAVAAAHDQGIQHRDLKPANVMVTSDGRVKVLDFGLAKLQRPSGSLEGATQMLTGEFTGDLTSEGKIVGTISYMSPEQAQGAALDHRSDIFSLGILLYEMITGKKPFDGPNNISVLSAILKDEPRSISDVRAKGEIPLPLARIIHRALAKRPEQRYQSARDLKQDLADLHADLSAEQLVASGLHSGVHEAPRAERKVRTAGLIMAGVIVAAAAIMSLLFFGVLGDDDGVAVSAAVSRSEVPSLAVLPFDNLAGDEDLDWLRHGLPEMLVTDLSQSPDLRVVGNDRVHSIMASAGHGGAAMAASDVQAVAREVGVSVVITGSFVRAGAQVRIDARVEDAESSEVLASERVTGGAEDIFELVDSLSGRIRERVATRRGAMAAEMVADMSAAGMGDRDLAEVTTGSVEAYRLYTEGQRRLHEGRPREAIPLFERAVALDPDFGMAWAKLSVAQGNTGQRDVARESAARAYELADSMPLEEQLYVHGRYYSLDPATLADSIAAYQRAADLFPENTAVRNNLGIGYMNLGEPERAIPPLEQAIALGTEFAGAYTNLARAYAQAERIDDALGVLTEQVERDPGDAAARGSLGVYLSLAGRLDEAYEQLQTAVALDPEPDLRAHLMAMEAWRRDWEAVEAHLAELGRSGEGFARQLEYNARGSLAQLRGQPEEAYAIYARGAETFEPGSYGQAQMIINAIDLAEWLNDAERMDRLADRLAAAQPPAGQDQIVPIARMLADASRGDLAGAREHEREFQRLMEGVELPERVQRQIEARLDGAIAWASGDAETAAERLAVAFELTAEKVESAEAVSIAFIVGETLWELDRREEAREWFLRLDRAPLLKAHIPLAAVRTEFYLGQIAAERGEIAEALTRFRNFLGFWEDGQIDRERVAEARRYVEANG